MSTYYAIVYSGNKLSHYGVPGMKWGVRKMASTIGRTANSYGRLRSNVSKQGLVKGAYRWHAENVSRRLNNMSSDRKKWMSARQKNSYKNSKEYWNARAEGKTNKQIKAEGNYRGIIKRTYDSHRSRSLATRAGLSFTHQLINNFGENRKLRSIGGATNNALVSSTVDTALGLAGDELVSRLFGHY